LDWSILHKLALSVSRFFVRHWWMERDLRTRERWPITKTGTFEEWLAARLGLLDAEKELTRQRRSGRGGGGSWPWVPGRQKAIDSRPMKAAYRCDLFGGRSQLLVYTSCSGPATSGVSVLFGDRGRFDGFVVHWRTMTSRFGGVAGALAKAAGVQAADGVEVSLGVSLGSDFNFDFKVSFRESSAREPSVQLPKTAIGSRAKEIAAIEAVIDVATEAHALRLQRASAGLATYARETPA